MEMVYDRILLRFDDLEQGQLERNQDKEIVLLQDEDDLDQRKESILS